MQTGRINLLRLVGPGLLNNPEICMQVMLT